jgi:hypothetical protein
VELATKGMISQHMGASLVTKGMIKVLGVLKDYRTEIIRLVSSLTRVITLESPIGDN